VTHRRLSRRDTLKILGAGASAAAATVAGPARALLSDQGPGIDYFRLADVRLGSGPFLDAQALDAAYLLRLEPDRLLHNFRVNAGLEPRAPVYGGWESVEPWIDIRCHGHTLGHYLSAAACLYEGTGDPRFAQRVDYLVAELAACQSKTGGWLTAFPDGVAPLADSLAGRPFAGVPWYTTHKVLAGLRDAHRHRGSTAALEVWVKFTDWIRNASRDVPAANFQKMLEREHGGMNEVCADLFAVTRDTSYLELAQRFSHQALLEPLAQMRDTLDGLHANTQIPKVVGFSRISQLGAAGDYGRAAEFFWRTVTQQRSFATGGHGDGEHFFPPRDFARHLGSAKTMETCCTHNMLRLTRSIYTGRARVQYMDYFERALFNGILASQDPDSGMMTYFQSTRPGYVKLYHTPFDSFWCCTGSGLENHARYAETIYARDRDVLYVNLFMASTLEWRERGLTVRQDTSFPDGDRSRLSFETAAPQELKLALRHPQWCPVMTLLLNGRKKYTSRRPGEYFELATTVKRGDTLELRLPMSLRLESLPDDPGHAAVMYGPIVLAAVLAAPGVEPASQLIVNERKSGEMLNEPVAIPRWPRPLEDLPAHFTRTDPRRLTFLAAGFEGGPVRFIPWFRVAHERYNLYWQRGA
jgi:uncharacterized protein